MSDYDVTMSERLLYQVTLASGRVVTRPEDFGLAEDLAAVDYFRPVFAEDGRLLTVEAEAARNAAQQ
jgi:hypothetical protein